MKNLVLSQLLQMCYGPDYSYLKIEVIQLRQLLKDILPLLALLIFKAIDSPGARPAKGLEKLIKKLRPAGKTLQPAALLALFLL